MKLFLAAQFSHAVGSQKVDKYVRTTQVPNYNTPPPDTIDPYERFTSDPGGSTCQVFNTGYTGPHNPWLKPYPGNTFAHTPGDQVDFAVAHKRGFKNVQGARVWHGAFGWISSCVVCPTEICADGTTRRSYQGSPDQTKYLVCTFDAALHANRDGGALWSVDATASGARTVDAQSGEVTSTLSTSETDKHAPDGGGDPVVTKNVTNGADSVTGSASGQSTLLDAPVATDFHCGYPIVPQTPDPSAFPSNDGNKNLLEMLDDWNSTQGTVAFSTTFPPCTDPNNYDQTVQMGNGLAVIGSFRIAWSRTATVFSWTVEGSYSNSGDTQSYSFTGTITLSSTNTATDVESDIFDNLLSTWPLNDDKLYPYRTDLKTGLAPLVTRNEVTGIASTIGFNPFTIDDLRSPINDASGNTPFSAGWTPTFAQIDWLDINAWAFTFADGSQVGAGGALPGTAAATGLLHLVDGSIVGAPLPAGYQNAFDFGFSDQRGCCHDRGEGGQFWQWYTFGSGQDVISFNQNTFGGDGTIGLPLNATQANNWFEATNKTAGPWIIYADQGNYVAAGCATGISGAGDTGRVMVQKWAEIIEGWNSQNFARPAGDDKFAYDETKVLCAANVSGAGEGSIWTLIDSRTGVAPTSFDTSLIWGGTSVNGFYAIASWDGTNVTLGPLQFAKPANWVSRSNGDDTQAFGPLRWPTVPALLGRVAITPDAPGTTMTFASEQFAFGLSALSATLNQEQVDLYDKNMTLLAGNVTATRVDDSTFTIAAAQPNAAWVQIHGAPAYYFNDNQPKGNFALLQWWFDYRNSNLMPNSESQRLAGVTDCDGTTAMSPSSVTYTNYDGNGNDVTVAFPTNGYSRFTQTPDCLPFVPCAPKVVCISPNGETFPNGKTYALPSVPLDEQYGTRWQGIVQSTMTDLLWQPPHFPCNLDFHCDKWLQDDGTCQPDSGTGNECPTESTHFYGFPPQVEALLALPNNYGAAQNETAPALPTGIQIGWLSPVNHTSADGDVAFPPIPPGPSDLHGVPNDASATWDLHFKMCSSAGSCERFNYSLPQC